jgi:hypothetical protein
MHLYHKVKCTCIYLYRVINIRKVIVRSRLDFFPPVVVPVIQERPRDGMVPKISGDDVQCRLA